MAKIRLSVHQSTGTLLKGAHTKQHAYPSIEISHDNNKPIIEIDLTFEQLAQMLVSHSDVTCTISHYVGPKGVEKEQVEVPPTITERANDAFGECHTELLKRIKALHTRVYDLLNVGKAGKADLKEVLRDIQVVFENYKGNQGFMLQQTQEQVDQMRDNAVTQIHALLASSNLPQQLAQSFEEAVPKLAAPNKNEVPIKAEPVIIEKSDYQKVIKTPEQMTNLELSDNITYHLKRFEAMPENHQMGKEKTSKLFWSHASDSPKGVNMLYVNYQGSHLIDHDKAVRYLKFLQSIKTFKEFKTDYNFEERE